MASTEKGKQDVRNLVALHLGEYDGAHPFEGVEDKFTQTTAAVQAAADEHKAGRITREEAEARGIKALDDECEQHLANMFGMQPEEDQQDAEEREFTQVLNTLFSR